MKTLSCWQQFLVMTFGQLGKRESLRDICLCLEAHRFKLYHLGLSVRIRFRVCGPLRINAMYVDHPNRTAL